MSRNRLYRTEAIVLSRRDFGEADRILTLLTPDRGKVSAIAKGVRRLTSRHGGHVELFTYARMLLAEGRNLDVVSQAETIEPYAGLRGDLLRTSYACHVAETTRRFVREGEGSVSLFRLLRDTLAALAEGDDPALAARYFELRLLDLLGYRPELAACPGCGVELGPEGNAFGVDAGGVLCPRCASADPHSVPLTAAAFRVLRFLQARDWAEARRVDMTPGTRALLERTMTAYMRYHLEGDLDSLGFIRRLREEEGRRDPGRTAPADPARTDGERSERN